MKIKAILFLAIFSLTIPAARAEDPTSLAKAILDDATPQKDREALVAANAKQSAEILAALVADLTPGTPEEYRRIPWIWRVTVAAGKRNDAAEIKRILEVALPAEGKPLLDWQAVVIGGGIINGLGLVGVWPGERVKGIVKADAPLKARWKRSLTLASAMADDPKVKNGTRYDALRMLGVEPWDLRGAQLARYLTKGTDNELMQGAISALGDIQFGGGVVGMVLLSGFDHYTKANQDFALDALLRDPARTLVLVDAIKAGRITAKHLGPKRIEALKTHSYSNVRKAAKSL